jgi:hypothetical protein
MGKSQRFMDLLIKKNLSKNNYLPSFEINQPNRRIEERKEIRTQLNANKRNAFAKIHVCEFVSLINKFSATFHGEFTRVNRAL